MHESANHELHLAVFVGGLDTSKQLDQVLIESLLDELLHQDREEWKLNKVMLDIYAVALEELFVLFIEPYFDITQKVLVNVDALISHRFLFLANISVERDV